MTWQILGWATAVSQVVGAGFLVRWLVTAVEPIRKGPPVPDIIVEVHLDGGSDYVGFV